MIVNKFNKGIARTITLVDWYGLSKDIKFICNTFRCHLIVEFYNLQKIKSSSFAIPLDVI
jgi:hypothetical protein